MKFRHCAIAAATSATCRSKSRRATRPIPATTLAACGGFDDTKSTDTTTADATDSAASEPISTAVDASGASALCDVYNDGFQPILDDPIAFGEDGWEERSQELVRLATQLEELAPAEQAANAAANAGYFQALADVESATDFVAGSNDFNIYVIQTCLN